MQKRVIFNQKGGVGKTSIVCNLAAISAYRGFKTLVIDLDTQANASQHLLHGIDYDPNKGIADFFENTLSFQIQTADLRKHIIASKYPNLSVISASESLELLQPKLEAKHKIYKLKQSLDKLTGFDAVYFDTPPALNFYSRSALIAAEKCLIPFDCDEFARQALYTLMQNLIELRADHNEDLCIEGIIVNQFQSQAKLPKKLMEDLKKEGHPIFAQTLSSSMKMRESHQCGIPLIYLDSKHKITQEY